MTSIVGQFEIYPDGYTAELRTIIATKLNIRETQLVFGAGSDELIQIISRTFLYPGVNTIMATPTFTQYKQHGLIDGAEIREIATIDGYHDLEGMIHAIDKDTKVIWICSPDNPSGTAITQTDFHAFMEKCPDNIIVVLDEAYIEFMNEEIRLDALEQIDSYKNLIILRTFSKAYGLAGLRIGYGIMDEKIAHNLDIVRGPFNTSTFAQKAAAIAFNDEAFIQETTNVNQSIKQSFQTFLDDLGWSYYNSHTNFVLVSTPISGMKVSDYLIENGFIVRPGELLGYPNTIRITIGNKEDMIILQGLLKKLHLKLSNEV